MALLGVNGAGKSTFLDIVLGLATPTQGDITVYGMSPREAVRRSLVSAMLQTGSMPRDGKVRNTIDLVAAMHANPIPTDELLERANLTSSPSARSTSSPAASASACASPSRLPATLTS